MVLTRKKGSENQSILKQEPLTPRILEKDQRLKYLRWKKRHQEQLKERVKTTCIIGVRCKDGVLLAGDTKVLRGADISYEFKIKPLYGLDLIYGSSGTTAMMDVVVEQINIALNRTEGNEPIIKTWYDFKLALEDIMNWTFNRYNPRDKNVFTDVLVGFKPQKAPAELWHFYPKGISQEIKKFDIIGSGEPYAMPFIKSLYYPEMSLNDMTWVTAFTLDLLDEIQVDYTIGGYLPQVVLMKDKKKKKDKDHIYQVNVEGILKSLRQENGNLSDNLWNALTIQQEK